jgi:hypothetical protein
MATVIGADKVRRSLSQLSLNAQDKLAKANTTSGAELIRLAKILIPVDTGASRAAIEGTANADGSYLCDFGPKAKVIEENRPFVNPALAVTRRKHKNRAKRAMKAAIKESFGG